MKVLYLVNSTLLGGATISFFNMVRELVKFGVEPIIAIPDKQAIQDEHLFRTLAKECGAKVYKIPITGHLFKKFRDLTGVLEFFGQIIRFFSLWYNEKKSVNAIKKIINKESPSIIHTNSGVIRCGWIASRKSHIQHIWHLREYQDLDFKRVILPSHAAFENMLNQSNVVAITKDIYNYFHQEQNTNAHVVYNGIFSINDVVNNISKEPYFLLCSRISPEKGHHDVIRAFSEFYKVNPNYKLKIAGSYSENDAYIQKIKQLAESSGCSEKIEFLGFQKDVKKLLAHAKCLIVASPNEGFGRMTAEACFMGTLVIGYNTAGTKEILDYTGGVLYDGTIGDLVSKMIFVDKMSNEDYVKISDRAKERAKALYSIEANGKSIYCIYSQCLKNGINFNTTSK